MEMLRVTACFTMHWKIADSGAKRTKIWSTWLYSKRWRNLCTLLVSTKPIWWLRPEVFVLCDSRLGGVLLSGNSWCAHSPDRQTDRERDVTGHRTKTRHSVLMQYNHLSCTRYDVIGIPGALPASSRLSLLSTSGFNSATKHMTSSVVDGATVVHCVQVLYLQTQ